MTTFNDTILKNRMEKLNEKKGARNGDFLKLPNGKYTRFTHDWGDSLQTGCLRIANESGNCGSFYLGSGSMSYSGSLDPAIDRSKLKLTDEIKLGRVWFFNNGEARAHNGIDFDVPLRVFELVEAEKHPIIQEIADNDYHMIHNENWSDENAGYWLMNNGGKPVRRIYSEEINAVLKYCTLNGGKYRL